MNHSPIQRFHSQSKLQNTFYSLSIRPNMIHTENKPLPTQDI